MNPDALYAKNYADESVLTQDEVNVQSIAVRRAPAVKTGGMQIEYLRDGLRVILPAGYDRLALYGLRGGTAEAVRTQSGANGFISRDGLAAGAYLLRASGTAGHRAVKVVLEP